MKGKRVPLILLVIIIVVLPILLIAIKQTLDNRSRASAADKLEVEGGILSSNGVSKQTDSNASGGSYALFQNQTNIPTPVSGTACKYPPNASYASTSAPSLSRPAYLTKVVHPTFNTEIYRVGDSTTMGTTAPIRHFYSKNQPWNANGTLLKLEGKYLLDGKTYAYKGKLPGGGLLWSYIDPDKLWSVSGNRLTSVSASTGTSTTIYTFTDYTTVSIGESEGNVSNDDKWVVLHGAKSNGENWIIVFDIANKAIVTQRSFLSLGGYNVPDWATISQSGKYVVINWRQRPVDPVLGGVISYDRNLNKIADLASYGAHGDVGYDASGNEVYAQVATMKYSRLDGGGSTNIFPGGSGQQGHLSMRAYKRPGWAYLSFDSSKEGLAVKLDGTGTTEKFTHTYTSGTPYEAEAHLAPSPDGTRVIWNSNWNGNPDSSVFPYVAQAMGGNVTCTPQ